MFCTYILHMTGLTKDKSESPFMLDTVGVTTMPSNRIGLSTEIDLTGLAQSPNALGTHNYQGKVQNNQIRIGILTNQSNDYRK